MGYRAFLVRPLSPLSAYPLVLVSAK